jgi:hypothetical protein
MRRVYHQHLVRLPSSQPRASETRVSRCQAVLQWLSMGVLFSVTLGCDNTGDNRHDGSSSSEAQRYISQSLSPKVTLANCVRAYDDLQSYEDRGFVRLRYQINGEWQEDRAPLSVAWDSTGRLGIRVYSTEAGPEGERWRLRIRRDDLAQNDQILSRAIPTSDTLDFEWLLDDPVVAQSLSAGLAGFPPQLDLLLSAEPLTGLVNDSSVLRFLPAESIDGRSCHVIEVAVAGRTYRVFVDKATLLMRRLVMPVQNVPPELLSGSGVKAAELSIELASVRVNHEVDWGEYRVQVGEDDYLVNRFVPTPVEWDVRGLGEKVPAFLLKGINGRVVYNSSEPEFARTLPRATVLVWLADHPACRAAADQIAMLASEVEKDPKLRGFVRIVPIWAEPNPPSGLAFEGLEEAWSLPGSVALDRDAVGRDLFGIDQAPSLVVLDSTNRIQLRETSSNPMLAQLLPGLLQKVCAGEDVAQAFLDDARNTFERGQTELRRSLAIDNQVALPRRVGTGSYRPQWFQVQLDDSTSMKEPVFCAAGDSDGGLWTLHDNGTLCSWQTHVGELAVQQTWTTDWKKVASRTRLEIDSLGRYAAMMIFDSNRLEVFDTQDESGFRVNLRAGERLIDARWFQSTPDAQVRLAAITAQGTLLLIDPSNRQQLSGRCPAPPVALVPDFGASTSSSSGIQGYVVLQNRSLEAIEIQDVQQATSLPGEKAKLIAKTVGFRRPTMSVSDPLDQPKELPFQPSAGCWQVANLKEDTVCLGYGWKAKDEPAAILVNSELETVWSYRTALQSSRDSLALTNVATDPQSGLPVWVFKDAEETVYLLRGDGMADHFRLAEPVVAARLSAIGTRLMLNVVHRGKVDRYSVVWK